jgi:hypothetical protein
MRPELRRHQNRAPRQKRELINRIGFDQYVQLKFEDPSGNCHWCLYGMIWRNGIILLLSTITEYVYEAGDSRLSFNSIIPIPLRKRSRSG